jgi:hypothetical protein
MTTKATGRPASPFPERYPLRHDDDQRSAWAQAAATCGLSLPEWIRATLDGEARKATHVPMIKREGRRG